MFGEAEGRRRLAGSVEAKPDRAEARDGEPRRNRTFNPQIESRSKPAIFEEIEGF